MIILKVGFLGGPWVVRLAAVAFAAAAVASVRIPKPTRVATAAALVLADEELHAISIRMAATSMAVLRAGVGFMTFFVAFAFRAAGRAVVVVRGGAGLQPGGDAGRQPRRSLRCAGSWWRSACCWGAWPWWRWWASSPGGSTAWLAFSLIAGATGVAAAAGKLAFDSIVQRDAPDAVRGRTFARFETRFQLVWVAGAFVPVAVTISTGIGIDMIALGSALAFFSYLGAIKTAKHRQELEDQAATEQ